MTVLRQLKIWDGRSVENVRMNMYAKFRCVPLRTKKALGIFYRTDNNNNNKKNNNN